MDLDRFVIVNHAEEAVIVSESIAAGMVPYARTTIGRDRRNSYLPYEGDGTPGAGDAGIVMFHFSVVGETSNRVYFEGDVTDPTVSFEALPNPHSECFDNVFRTYTLVVVPAGP